MKNKLKRRVFSIPIVFVALSAIIGTQLGSAQIEAATPPAVSTSPATAITVAAATLNGNLNSLGTAVTVNASFEYGTTVSYGSTANIQAINALGPFSANVTGLAPGTVYHFRADVDGGVNGASTGADLTFTTLAPPSVGTNAATNVRFNTATLNGILLNMGLAGSVRLSFQYA